MYYVVFGFIAVVLVGFLYSLIYNSTDWNPYAVWIAALTAATLAMYGFDKGLAKMSKARVPEKVLHLLAILGGFLGGWLGMAFFGHKTNVRKHLSFFIVLILSTIGHGALTYYWFFRGA